MNKRYQFCNKHAGGDCKNWKSPSCLKALTFLRSAVNTSLDMKRPSLFGNITFLECPVSDSTLGHAVLIPLILTAYKQHRKHADIKREFSDHIQLEKYEGT